MQSICPKHGPFLEDNEGEGCLRCLYEFEKAAENAWLTRAEAGDAETRADIEAFDDVFPFGYVTDYLLDEAVT